MEASGVIPIAVLKAESKVDATTLYLAFIFRNLFKIMQLCYLKK